MTDRTSVIDAFLERSGWSRRHLQPLAGDASFRRYGKLIANGRRAVLMDAPPLGETVRPFMSMVEHLIGLGLSAPAILCADEDAGLLLLEDFGDDTFSRLLAARGDEYALYALAIDVLAYVHRLPADDVVPPGLPRYDPSRLLDEALLFVDWYLPDFLATAVATATRQAFVDAWTAVLPPVLAAPVTLVLRDFHVDNLMYLPEREGLSACGLLDFQDAVAGPAAYDVMSLLEDARRDVPDPLAASMIERYAAAVDLSDRGHFQKIFAVLAAQRHCKVIGIFTRLHKRDRKPAYLAHIPRVWRLLERALKHPALAPVAGWFETHVPAALRSSCPKGSSMTAYAGVGPVPAQSMVLAAGLGVRMRPITEKVPKPLIVVAGRTMLDRALDELIAVGVDDVVINTHYLGAMIEAHVRGRREPHIRLSHEDVLLDTGGGIARAVRHFGERPFFVVNGDTLWRNGPRPALVALAEAWNETRMDALLLLQPVSTAIGYRGLGDFFRSSSGSLERRADYAAPFVFAGIQILHPRLFADAPEGAFSINVLFDRAIACNRLHGVVHDGGWCHVGTPADIPRADAFFALETPPQGGADDGAAAAST